MTRRKAAYARPLACVLAGTYAATIGACTPGAEKADFNASSPPARIAAIAGAPSSGLDREEIRRLIEQLDSDDPAVRVFAIATLRRANDGDDLGYDPAAGQLDRKQAVEAWVRWYDSPAAGAP